MNQNAVAFLAALTVLWVADATPQPTVPRDPPPSRPVPAQNIQAESVSPPEWFVWRVFHDSLLYYQQRSPAAVSELLEKRAQLDEVEVEFFLDSGASYLQALSRIDEKARSEVEARYQTNVKLPQQAQQFFSQSARGQGLQTPSIFIVGQTPDGRPLYDALVAGGLIERVEQQKRAVLQNHLEQLRSAVGIERVAKVEEWIRADVASRVVFGSRLPIAQRAARSQLGGAAQIPREQP